MTNKQTTKSLNGVIKTLMIAAICIVFPLLTDAQNTLKDNLTAHVRYLASDEMKGRAVNSAEVKLAMNYLKDQISQMGLQVIDYPIVSDSFAVYDYGEAVEEAVYAEDDDELKKQHAETLIYNNFYTIIPSETKTYGNEYLYLTVNVNGYGVDTIKGYNIIKNSANNNASSAAVLTELVRHLSANRHLLKRDVIVMFTDSEERGNTGRYFAKHYDKGSFKMAVFLNNLGYLGFDEDESKYIYSISSGLKNAGTILQPILMKDVDVPTFAEYDEWSGLRTITVEGNFLPYYKDVEDSLQYDNMVKITEQLQNVIVAFDTSDIKVDSLKNSDGWISPSDVEDWGNNLIMTKQRSYFGINLMIGSNKHYYTKGRTTGKAAMSYSAGIFYKLQLSQTWALKLDANYERAYANRHDGRFASDVLSVPLSLMIATGANEFEILYGFGAYFDYAFSARLNKQDVDWDYFNKGEWGLQFSLGMRIGHFLIGYYQKLGMSDMMTDKYLHNGKIKNRNMYLTLGFAF